MSLNAPKTTAALAIGAALVCGLAACGSSSAADQSSPAPNQGPAGGGQFPGANGLIAAVSGKTLQVQSDTAQTQVTFSDSTAITESRSVGVSAVRVGDCVVVNGSDSSGDTVTAQMVNVSTAVNGECSSGLPGGGGAPGRSRPSGAPSIPEGATPPSGAPGGAGGGFTIASGKVTSVAASGLELTGQLRKVASGGPSSSAGSVKVTLASGGTVMKQVTVSASVLVVGQCARALGDPDAKGAISATSINVSAPTDGSCSGGFGGGRRQ